MLLTGRRQISSKLLIGHIFRFHGSRVQLFGILCDQTHACEQHAGPHLGTLGCRVELSGVVSSETTESRHDSYCVTS